MKIGTRPLKGLRAMKSFMALPLSMPNTSVFEVPLVDPFLGPRERHGGIDVCGDDCVDVLLQLLD